MVQCYVVGLRQGWDLQGEMMERQWGRRVEDIYKRMIEVRDAVIQDR